MITPYIAASFSYLKSLYNSYSSFLPPLAGLLGFGSSLYKNYNLTRKPTKDTFLNDLNQLGLQFNPDSSNFAQTISDRIDKLSNEESGGTRNAATLQSLFNNFKQQKSKADKLDTFGGQYE